MGSCRGPTLTPSEISKVRTLTIIRQSCLDGLINSIISKVWCTWDQNAIANLELLCRAPNGNDDTNGLVPK